MKAKVIKESVIYNGEIIKLGTEFEIDDAVGKALVERGYIAIPSEECADDAISEADGIAEMSYKELKAYASKLGLKADGKKEELIARIRDFENQPECEEDEEEDTESESEIPNTSMPE